MQLLPYEGNISIDEIRKREMLFFESKKNSNAEKKKISLKMPILNKKRYSKQYMKEKS